MPKIQTLDLNPLVERTCALLGRVLDPRIALRLERGPGLPPVLGDPGLLEQMVLRLGLLEADALGPAGGSLVVRTFRHPDGRPGLELDRGSGAVAGEGPARLGTLQDILDIHGAEILADGPAAGGWSLALALPADSAQPKAAVQGAGPSHLPRLDGVRILVAEDEAEIRYFLREVLGQLGAEVVPAVDGEDAWNMWALLGPFDLLLTDQRMPRLTGMELVQRVRKDRPGFPVVVMSGYGMEEFAGALSEDPRLRYLGKPFMLPVLLEVIGNMVGAQAPRA